MNQDDLRRELEHAQRINANLPKAERVILERARKVEEHLGYVPPRDCAKCGDMACQEHAAEAIAETQQFLERCRMRASAPKPESFEAILGIAYKTWCINGTLSGLAAMRAVVRAVLEAAGVERLRENARLLADDCAEHFQREQMARKRAERAEEQARLHCDHSAKVEIERDELREERDRLSEAFDLASKRELEAERQVDDLKGALEAAKQPNQDGVRPEAAAAIKRIVEEDRELLHALKDDPEEARRQWVRAENDRLLAEQEAQIAAQERRAQELGAQRTARLEQAAERQHAEMMAVLREIAERLR